MFCGINKPQSKLLYNTDKIQKVIPQIFLHETWVLAEHFSFTKKNSGTSTNQTQRIHRSESFHLWSLLTWKFSSTPNPPLNIEYSIIISNLMKCREYPDKLQRASEFISASYCWILNSRPTLMISTIYLVIQLSSTAFCKTSEICTPLNW